MPRGTRRRFWVEVATAAFAAAALVLWLAAPTWIESVVGIDPDGGSGLLEALIAAGLIALVAASTVAARSELALARSGA